MTAILILWGHALAALLFGALGLAEWRRGVADRWSGRAFVVALALTALWALAVAGIDARDVSTQAAEAARDIAWLCVMAASVKQARAGHVTLAVLYVVVTLVAAAAAIIALLERGPFGDDLLLALGLTRTMLRMMAIAGALLLLSHLAQATEAARTGARRLFVLALATMWGFDLGIAVMAFVRPDWTAMLVVARGPAMAAVALLLAASTTQRGAAPATVSRTVATRLLAGAALLLYAGSTALAASLAGMWAGDQARLAQTAIVFGATAALLALVSTPWLRAWMRVKVAKHLFSHRYDYRIEWQRFTATLGVPGDGAAPLDTRIVKAVADLTDSPAGLLLVADAGALVPAAGWRWADGGRPMEAAFAERLTATGRILSLDEARGAADGAAPPPDWLLADRDAWAVVPLIHGDDLAGAIVLARPPIDRPLDWEDFDLLRVAGRQAASYLAEDRAHAALADAQRFEEFNRRFAFLMHDIKNVASQLTLVARNAERHADNPDFRADMVVTLRDSAARMTTLLARLGQHDGARPEATQPVDAAALARRIAANWRARHPVEVGGDATAMVLAQPGRLEQALCHLVQNAVEASPAGAAVALSVRGERGGVAIEVIDHGCGMTPGFVRDRLFRPFASSKPDGFGIGAYEARQLVRTMGGEMDVESRRDEGTRFRIRLPQAVPATMEHAA